MIDLEWVIAVGIYMANICPLPRLLIMGGPRGRKRGKSKATTNAEEAKAAATEKEEEEEADWNEDILEEGFKWAEALKRDMQIAFQRRDEHPVTPLGD